MAATEEIVYDQSVRAIEQQQRSLDALRGRTAILLAAAGVITTFAADTGFASCACPEEPRNPGKQTSRK